MSAPATNAFSPAPVKTTTATESSSRNAIERGADVQLHLPVDRVADVRPVDGDHRDAVGDLGEQRLVVGRRRRPTVVMAAALTGTRPGR